MKYGKLILSAFALLSLSSCSLINFKEYDLKAAFYRLMKVERRATNLMILDNEENLKAIPNDDSYDVLVITDVHFGNENHGKNGPRRENEWFAQLTEGTEGNRIVDNVRFAICLGDVAEHGRLEECERFDTEIRKKLENIKGTKCPDGIKIYNVVGNHDLYNDGWQNWSLTMYPHTSFYKFETPSFSWYFLDSASGTLGGYQYDAFEASMRSDKKQKLVFSHVPVYAADFHYFTMQNTEERNRIISTCAGSSTQLFLDGHTHDDRTTDFGKFVEKNFPGFLERYGYGILHIDEKKGTASFSVIYF